MQTTMQDGIQNFLSSLNSVQTDRFVRVMGRLESLGAQGEIQRLRDELNTVKLEIEKVNRKREELRIEKQDMLDIVEDLDRWPDGRSHQDLVQFRYMICNLISDLDEKIANSRPVELHEKKAAIKKEMANRRLLADLAGMLRTTANRHGD